LYAEYIKKKFCQGICDRLAEMNDEEQTWDDDRKKGWSDEPEGVGQVDVRISRARWFKPYSTRKAVTAECGLGDKRND
jgi:hypothetical protein